MTGYVHRLMGKNADLKLAILTFASAFGGWNYASEESTTKIPKYDDHHKVAVPVAEKKLADFRALPKKEKRKMFDEERNQTILRDAEAVRKDKAERAEMTRLKELIMGWDCPELCIKVKEFALKQITESEEFMKPLVEGEYVSEAYSSFDKWCQSKEEYLLRDIEYHTEGSKKSKEAYDLNMQWYNTLMGSLESK